MTSMAAPVFDCSNAAATTPHAKAPSGHARAHSIPLRNHAASFNGAAPWLIVPRANNSKPTPSNAPAIVFHGFPRTTLMKIPAPPTR